MVHITGSTSPVSFLSEQLTWLRSAKHPTDSQIGKLYSTLSAFADFAGITVCYGGNKSLHIHVVFETDMLGRQLHPQGWSGRQAPRFYRQGLMALWDRLMPDVRSALGFSGEFDPKLREPEMYRRMPNGMRQIGQPKPGGRGHCLGAQPGELIPQITLWEKWRERAGIGSTALFLDPTVFVASPNPVRQRITQMRGNASFVGGGCSDEDIAYCSQKLSALYPESPRFSHLAMESGRWVAHFYNDAADQNPSSIMREDHRTVLLVGSGAANAKPKALEYPLGLMLKFWMAERERSEFPDAPEVTLHEVVVAASPSGSGHPLEVAFQRHAEDRATARTALRRCLLAGVRRHKLLWVRAAEGAGKSSGLFQNHHRLAMWLARSRRPHLTMFASASYEQAKAKCDEFNVMQQRRGFVGVVLPSFSRAYRDACARLNLTPLSYADAARRGHATMWKAIVSEQPTVMDELRAMHVDIWKQVGSGHPVFFTAHDTLQRWNDRAATRWMWARDFWKGDATDQRHREQCRFSMRLGLAVHDEAAWTTVADAQPKVVLDWITDMRNDQPRVWGQRWTPLDEQYAAYAKFTATRGSPIGSSGATSIGFELARSLTRVPSSEWDLVTTEDTGEYVVRRASDDEGADEAVEAAHRDIYDERHGRSWCVRSKNWWSGLAERVLVLTTERLPTAIARRSDAAWQVLELDAAGLPRDYVDVHPRRGVTGSGVRAICEEWRRERGDDFFVISNRVSDLPRSMPHVTARGSNDLIGDRVVQTLTYMTPDEYEQLQALNAWAQSKRGDGTLRGGA